MADIDLRPIARLARLRFSDAELKLFESQVADILKFVDGLKAVDVSGVAPTSHPLAITNVFREDQPAPSRSVEDFLSHSPAHYRRFFAVPKIIEGK